MMNDFFDDDVFDILGMSFFGSGKRPSEGIRWCRRTSAPCIPLSSCDKYFKDGTCKYASDSTEDSDDRE